MGTNCSQQECCKPKSTDTGIKSNAMVTDSMLRATDGAYDNDKDDEYAQQSTSYFDREEKELNHLKKNAGNGVCKNGVPYKFQSGAQYKGQWESNVREGYGKQTWPDGATYEGQWRDNVAVGKGRFTHSDGDVYIGEWQNNKASGMGTYYHQGTTTYRGQWRSDAQDGHGIETWKEGARYEGLFREGQKDGFGCHHWIDGSEYQGKWCDNFIDESGLYQTR